MPSIIASLISLGRLLDAADTAEIDAALRDGAECGAAPQQEQVDEAIQAARVAMGGHRWRPGRPMSAAESVEVAIRLGIGDIYGADDVAAYRACCAAVGGEASEDGFAAIESAGRRGSAAIMAEAGARAAWRAAP